MIPDNPVKAALLGLAMADAIGVPVEFHTREQLKTNPVTDIRGYGTYQQPPGTWSDDSSLTFCLAESLLKTYDLKDMAEKFIAYKVQAHWTPYQEVFDIGITTSHSISRLSEILENGQADELKTLRHQADERANGNGALMRILPLYFYLRSIPEEHWFEQIWEASALTHGHIRSAIACWIYLRMFHHLLLGLNKKQAYQKTQEETRAFFQKENIDGKEVALFVRLIEADIALLPESAIQSDGYVLHSLEASFWCLLNQDSYRNTVLQAVNLGNDTDTTAAIVGGLAGIYYGEAAIPKHWKKGLARLEDIEDLCDQLFEKYEAALK